MDRRELLRTAAAAAATMPFMSLRAIAAGALRAKITDIKPAQVKIVQKLGSYGGGVENFHTPSEASVVNIGGFGIIEISTDQGAVGFGPGATPQAIKAAKDYLIGKDPFEVADHSRYLNTLGRGGTAIEMGLWDLCGKIAGLPLSRLWGGGKEKVMPYGATLSLGKSPEERAQAALTIKNQGFKGVKMRGSWPTLKQDIALMTLARQAIGPDTYLLVDANKSGPYGASQLNTIWDYQRAMATAMEFEKLGVYWLEEPLGRFDYEGLHKLHDSLRTLKLAGGENNTRMEDFREYALHDCYDVWNLDANSLGPTLWRQCADLGFAFGKKAVPHASGIIMSICQIHLTSCVPNPSWGRLDGPGNGPDIEIDSAPPYGDFNKQWSVFTNAPKLDADGYFAVPSEPGLGVTIQPDLIVRS